MVTDDERRRVAAALRAESGPSLMVLMSVLGVGGKDVFPRLADLIDPGAAKAPTSSDTAPTSSDATATCDMSQSCRDTVACDPTERGIDSIYDWCFGGLEGADNDEDELYCAIMRAIEDYRHPELATAHTVRAVDREALLALAEELANVRRWSCYTDSDLLDIADRIREALGVVG